MVIYEEIVEKELIIPQASCLYCLEPMGIGTAYIESQSSYISRLSHSHSIKPGVMFSHILFPYLDKHYTNQIVTRGGNGFYDSAHTINGRSDAVAEFSNMIGNLTGNNWIDELTLLRFKDVLPNRGLLRKHKAWCPVCFQEMNQLRKDIYEPLIWSIQNVTICMIHQINLEMLCPSCKKKNLIIDRRSQPGYCSRCGEWLGHAEVQVELNEWEQVKATMVAELFEFNVILKKLDLVRSLRQLVYRFANLNITEFARKIEVPKTTFWTWYSGRNIPTLEDTLRICNKFGFSLVELYANKTVNEKAFVIQAKRKKTKCNIRTNKSLFEIGILTRSFIQDHGKKSITVTTMAKVLECNKKTLYQHFRKQCKLQAIRSKKYQSDNRLLRLQGHYEEIKVGFTKVIETDSHPTSKKVTNNLLKPGILREPAVREMLGELMGKNRNTVCG